MEMILSYFFTLSPFLYDSLAISLLVGVRRDKRKVKGQVRRRKDAEKGIEQLRRDTVSDKIIY